MAKRCTRKGWRTANADPATVGSLLRQVGLVSVAGEPVSARASYDRAGHLRRITAVFADGWRATLNVRLTGGATLSQSWRTRLTSEPKSAT